MFEDLASRKAMVTGGARGLGYAMADALTASGVAVTSWTCWTMPQRAPNASPRSWCRRTAHAVRRQRRGRRRGHLHRRRGVTRALDIVVNSTGISVVADSVVRRPR